MPGLCWRLSQGEELGWLVARLWQAAGSGEPRVRVFAPWQRTARQAFQKGWGFACRVGSEMPAPGEPLVLAGPALTFPAGR